MSNSSNLKISFRHLRSDKTNTFISIAGLVLGLAIFAVILVFVLNELGYNHSFDNEDRIYRVLNSNKNDNHTWATTPFIVGESAKEQFAGVEAYAHQYNMGNIEIKKGDEFIAEPNMFCTESSFFGLFGVKLLHGSLDGFDNTDNRILLSREYARKYFGNENPVGKTLTLRYNGKESEMMVAAIYQNFPENSIIKAPVIGNIEYGIQHLMANLNSTGSIPDEHEIKKSWYPYAFFTNYLLIRKGVSVAGLEKELNRLAAQYAADKSQFSLSLQPASSVYFGSPDIIDNNRTEQGNLFLLYILGLVGLLILAVACINYINLASAQAMTRIGNFAVHKICGASGKSLRWNLILESTLVSVTALPFALLLASFFLPYVSGLLGKTYALSFNGQFLVILLIMLFTTVLTGILSGTLVAVRFSTFHMVNILKGAKSTGGHRFGLQRAMVVFQITVFITLIASMFLVQKQVRYALNKDLGFKKEGLVGIPLGDHNPEIFKKEIEQNPNVLSASGTIWMPPNTNKMFITIPRVDTPDEKARVSGLFVGYHFAKTMGLEMIMGDDFDEETNNSGVLVNESAVKELGLTGIIGEKTAFGIVKGVVKDFSLASIHEVIPPSVIVLNPSMARVIAVRVNTQNLPETMDFLKRTWNKTEGTSPFNYSFTDELLEKIYQTDIRFSKTIGLLSVIAIVIASLGLLGLSLFMSRQRTKEIGIRKVNGAKISEIMAMLNKDFVIWVVIAFVIAIPIAYYAMNKWLENFAYKTELSWWIFALAGLLALGIALLTVSWQSWKAATRNPVEALRYE